MKSNGIAIAGFITGLTGFIFSWIPFLPMVILIVGLVLSSIGYKNYKKTNKNKGFSVAGIVLSIVGLFSQAVILITMIGITASVANELNDIEKSDSIEISDKIK